MTSVVSVETPEGALTVDIDRPPVGDGEVRALRCLVRQQLTEVHRALCGVRITCPCGRRVAAAYAYRCLRCGLWLCRPCAERHFAEPSHTCLGPSAPSTPSAMSLPEGGV